jgi:hypothetical protein
MKNLWFLAKIQIVNPQAGTLPTQAMLTPHKLCSLKKEPCADFAYFLII